MSDLQHQFRADRFLELYPLAGRHDKSAGAAEHAILVIDIKVVDIHGESVRPREHDRQAIDGDAGSEDIDACERDEGAAVVGAVARDVHDTADGAIAAS